MSNLHTLGIGMIAYATEFRGILPWDGWAEGDRNTDGRDLGPWHEPAVWFNAMPKYAGMDAYCDLQDEAAAGGRPLPKQGSTSLFSCPSAMLAASESGEDKVLDGYIYLYGREKNGEITRRPTFWCYAFNTKLDQGIEDRKVPYRVTMPLAKIRNPSITCVLMEKLMRPQEYDPPYAGSIGQQQCSYKEFTTRHRGGGFILMADGHVAFFTRNEVFFPPTAPYTYELPGRLTWDPPK